MSVFVKERRKIMKKTLWMAVKKGEFVLDIIKY